MRPYSVRSFELVPEDRSVDLQADEVGLYSKNYKSLFGVRFDAHDGSRPWKKRILVVEYVHSDSKRARIVLRRFRGVAGLTAAACMLSLATRRELGISDKTGSANVQVYPALRVWGRIRFYWDHPIHATRVSYKLGFTALLIGLLALGISAVQVFAS